LFFFGCFAATGISRKAQKYSLPAYSGTRQKVETMTILKSVRFQYGQIPMQYEIQHCTMREGENADPEMVRIHECERNKE